MNVEFRRGVLVLAILRLLDKEQYGYSLREILNRYGLEINEGTLYPLLRRLESQKLLKSDWRIGDGRPRKYYRISGKGKTSLEKMSKEWTELVGAMNNILGMKS
ncbi:MAG: PadR family transcriptional regulator [Bacteroidales bacterium]|nr:PadR family transcriptional regulator [Candidatus Latescibacterota bacterium]